METEKELREQLYRERELQSYHAPYGREYGFYEAVELGDVETLKSQFLQTPFYELQGLGRLSDDFVRHIKYHVIISIALVCRYCIEGGMEPERAYGLSDLYIRQADVCTRKEMLAKVHSEMTLDYAARMRELRKEKVFSKHVVVCMEYIYKHLHEKISLRELAEQTGLHENYLSHLFRQETGGTVGSYIRDRKLEQAEYMLKHTDKGVAEIAGDLNFSSQSYFIQVFKKKNGKTPREYRDYHYRNHLKDGMKHV